MNTIALKVVQKDDQVFYSSLNFCKTYYWGLSPGKALKEIVSNHRFLFLLYDVTHTYMGIGFHRLFQTQTFTSALSFRKSKRI